MRILMICHRFLLLLSVVETSLTINNQVFLWRHVLSCENVSAGLDRQLSNVSRVATLPHVRLGLCAMEKFIITERVSTFYASFPSLLNRSVGCLDGILLLLKQTINLFFRSCISYNYALSASESLERIVYSGKCVKYGLYVSRIIFLWYLMLFDQVPVPSFDFLG